MDEEIPAEAPKRGRGRPTGSLNKKTIERMATEAAAREGQVPEAPEETSEETPEPETPEPEAPEPEVPEPEVPEPPPRPKRKAAAKRVEAPPRAKRAPRVASPRAEPRVDSPKPRSYLEVLREGLEDARRRQKQERSTRYDSYFAFNQQRAQ